MNRSGGVERQRCAREERDTRKGLTELKTRQERGRETLETKGRKKEKLARNERAR